MATPTLPDPLRERLLAQHKRVRLVRISFALTIAAALVVSFGVALFQGISPTARSTFIILRKGGEKPEAWLMDQTFDPVSGEAEGSFRIASWRGGEAAPGAALRGVARGFVPLDEKRALAVFNTHFLEFDLSGEPASAGWPKVVRQQNLGINEVDASPTVALHEGKAWLCWLAGGEARIRPLEDPEVVPAMLQNELQRGATLKMLSAEGRLWLTITDKQNGALKLLWFKPRLDPTQPQGGDGGRAKPGMAAHVEGLHTSDVTREVRASSLAVLNGEPIVVLQRRDAERQGKPWELWRYTNESWTQEAMPEFPVNALMLSMSSASLSANDGTVAMAYSDGRSAYLALGKSEKGKLVFGEAKELGLADARGLGPVLVWIGVMMALMLLLAGQGLWLLLNRSQELDRTLAGLLQKTEKSDKTRPKAETMLHANLLARAIALLVDLGVTSPLVIMLKAVYKYDWSQAYGFLLPISAGAEPQMLLAALQASLVTLSILTIYAMVCELIWGRTFGKALLHLRVVDKEGEQPSAWQIVVRNLVRIFEIAHWALFLIPAALMMMGGKQQRLGDMLARTHVIVDVVPEDQADDLEI